MAKFAEVGYGSNGRGVGKSGQGYTYIVDDSVRAGDVIVPIRAFNVLAKRDINTMAVALSTTKDLNRDSEKNVKIKNKQSGGLLKDEGGNRFAQTSYTSEDIRQNLEEKGYATLDENGKILGGGKAENMEYSGLKSVDNNSNVIRNYGNEQQFQSQISAGKDMLKEINAREKETYDSYAKKFQ